MASRILFCSPEVAPYAKTGGLADVAAALPGALKKRGYDVRIFMPLYRCVGDQTMDLEPVGQEAPGGDSIPVGARDFHVHFLQTATEEGVPVYFLEKDEFFDRSHLYGSPRRGDYEDNPERFIVFCRAIEPLCHRLNWFPQVLHLHDWQAALTSAYRRFPQSPDSPLAGAATVLTIHNLGYQGLFPAARFPLTGLPPQLFSPSGMEFWGQCNFLKAGLVYSDLLTTVSPSYSLQIQQPQWGHGLEGVLQQRAGRLRGILNGVDTKVWDPETDPLIPCNYTVEKMSGKRRCKESLMRELGWPEKQAARQPLLGMIGRLADQKGFDLLREILPRLMKRPLFLAILGTGDAATEKSLREAAKQYPERLRVLLRFDERLAHTIEAASDIFLMPSRYEPCGLNQMYSLRYGTIPLVHATGGLEDSIVDVSKEPDKGFGVKFRQYTGESFLQAVETALELHAHEESWKRIRERAMLQDVSWARAARSYEEVYEEAVEKRDKD